MDDRIVAREQQLLDELPELFAGCGSLLYIGANDEMHTGLELLSAAGYDITIVEVWPPHLGELRCPPLSELVGHVVEGDVREIDDLGLAVGYDVVMWFHGPEHIQRHEFEPTLAKLEDLTVGLIVLGAPWGNTMGLGPYPYAHHISYYEEADWEALGYEVRTMPPKDAHGGHMLGWKWTDW